MSAEQTTPITKRPPQDLFKNILLPLVGLATGIISTYTYMEKKIENRVIQESLQIRTDERVEALKKDVWVLEGKIKQLEGSILALDEELDQHYIKHQ